MNEQPQDPSTLKQHPYEQDARRMTTGVFKAFGVPWPRKPLAKTAKGTKGARAGRSRGKGRNKRQGGLVFYNGFE